MKVVPSVYNRMGIETITQAKIHPHESEAVVRKNIDPPNVKEQHHPNSSQSSEQISQIDKVTISNKLKANTAKITDVLSEQEHDMLKRLFPPEGMQWGVAAYERSSVSNSSTTGIGQKIDLTT